MEPRQLMAIHFAAAVHSPVGGSRVAVVADFSGDRLADVVERIANGTTLRFLPGLGNGKFVPTNVDAPIDAGPNVIGMVAGDLDRDGDVDLAALNGTIYPPPGSLAPVLMGFVQVMYNVGSGRFEKGPVLYAGGEPTSIAIADVNIDSRLDLVVGDSSQWSPPNTDAPTSYGGGVFFASNAGFSPVYQLRTPMPVVSVAATTAPVLNSVPPWRLVSVAMAGPDLMTASPLPMTRVVLVSPLIPTVAIVTPPLPQFGFAGDNRGIVLEQINRDLLPDFAVLQTIGDNSSSLGPTASECIQRPRHSSMAGATPRVLTW
jgi:hypothetical protein